MEVPDIYIYIYIYNIARLWKYQTYIHIYIAT